MNDFGYLIEDTDIVIERIKPESGSKRSARMENIICEIEGLRLDIEVEKIDRSGTEAEQKKRLYKHLTQAIRAQSGMNRVEFSKWLGIPYRTMQEWEIGRRLMPDYLLRLIAYKVNSEKTAGRLGTN